jgi:tetratricopeptide (TPR) repeat protein
MPRLASWTVWGAAFGLLCLVSLSGLSRWVEAEEPELAFRLNPLNGDARAATLVAALNTGPSGDSLDRLHADALAGLALAPSDARFFSLLGEIEQRRGNAELADQHFRSAHSLSHTEILALQHMVQAALVDRRFDEAVELIDLILRRWPNRFEALAGVFSPLLRSQQGYAALLDVLVSGAPWRGRLLTHVARAEGTHDLAYRLVLDLRAAGAFTDASQTDSVIGALYAAGRRQDAYRLFLFTRDGDDQRRTGFVHNGAFEPPLSRTPFDWQMRTTGSAEMGFLGTDRYGLAVRFLNRPATDLRLSQQVLLPAGRYKLIIEADASNLRAPRALFWQLRCNRPARQVARLSLDEGSYVGQIFETSFEIEDCDSATLSLATEVIAESFRYRYSGQISFRSARIIRDGTAPTN